MVPARASDDLGPGGRAQSPLAKAEQRLGLAPTPLEDALATTIDWFRTRVT